jgi:AraC-like DNA-binding protein
MINTVLLNVGYIELNANWNWTEVQSPFARIYYIVSGRARTRINDAWHELTPGHLYLIPPFTLHDTRCDSPFSLIYIHTYEKIRSHESIFEQYHFPFETAATELDEQLSRRLLAINPGRHLQHINPKVYDNLPTFSKYIAHNEHMSHHSLIETRAVINQLLSRFVEKAQIRSFQQDDRIRKCITHIHRNIDKEIPINTLADIACLSTDHLIRLFKKEIGATPLRYILAKKIEQAQLSLITTGKSIRDIALDIAIDNPSYFNRLFKSSTGKTPMEYRKEHERL